MQGTLYRQIDRLTHRQKDTQIDIQTGRSRHTDRWLVRKSRLIDGQKGRHDKQSGRQTDRYINKQMYAYK